MYVCFPPHLARFGLDIDYVCPSKSRLLCLQSIDWERKKKKTWRTLQENLKPRRYPVSYRKSRFCKRRVWYNASEGKKFPWIEAMRFSEYFKQFQELYGPGDMWVKNITNFRRFCYLNIPCLRINITLILNEFFKRWIHALVGKLKNRSMFLLVFGGHICALNGDTNMASHRMQSFINLGKTFFRISRIWNIAQTQFLARRFAHLPSFIS